MQKLICLECPNGCSLTITREADGTVDVVGNRCQRGVDFVGRFIEREKNEVADSAGSRGQSAKVISREHSTTYSFDKLAEVARAWSIILKALRPEIVIEGSPERTVFRIVVEDVSGQLFVMEQIPCAALHAKVRIVKLLAYLKEQGVPFIQPYLCSEDKRYIVEIDNGYWQIVPFLPAAHLDRGRYLYDDWRAPFLAQFLVELKRKTRDVPYYDPSEVFSLKNYIYSLLKSIEQHQPQILDDVIPVVQFLELSFMDEYQSLPAGFCHGDYHPLNIIWSPEGIRAVIDWEFSGYKPEIYDVANMVGCLGVEHPSSLTAGLVHGFIAHLKDAGIYSASSFDCLVEYIIALRFAWLSEWLRKADDEMLELELDYMRLLMDNYVQLNAQWGLKTAVF